MVVVEAIGDKKVEFIGQWSVGVAGAVTMKPLVVCGFLPLPLPPKAQAHVEVQSMYFDLRTSDFDATGRGQLVMSIIAS